MASEESQLPNPRVGVAAIVVNEQGQVLIGKRKGSHGAGTLQFPGGHLEHGEEPLDCAVREMLEETGLDVRAVRLVTVTNDVFVSDRKHYITLFALCTMEDPSAEPKVTEPEKCEMWAWWDWERLFGARETGMVEDIPLFMPVANLLKQFGTVKELKDKFQ